MRLLAQVVSGVEGLSVSEWLALLGLFFTVLLAAAGTIFAAMKMVSKVQESAAGSHQELSKAISGVSATALATSERLTAAIEGLQGAVKDLRLEMRDQHRFLSEIHTRVTVLEALSPSKAQGAREKSETLVE